MSSALTLYTPYLQNPKMDNREESFEFKDLDKQMEKKVDENIEEHIVPKAKSSEPESEPVRTESKAEEKKPKSSFFKRFKPELPKKFMQQPKQIGAPTPKKWDRLKRYFVECKRVLRVTRKPDKVEFKTIVKVSALGMVIIGVIGFAISLVKELIFK